MPVKNVLKLLKQFDNSPAAELTMKAEVVFVDYRTVVMAFDGAFVLCQGGEPQALAGLVGGFNRFAIPAARGLCVLGRITNKDYEDFLRWFTRKEEQNEKESTEGRLRALAAHLGWKLVKEGE